VAQYGCGGGGVWRLVQKPKRFRLMPWQLVVAAWGNVFLPGLYDNLIERIFVRPETRRSIKSLLRIKLKVVDASLEKELPTKNRVGVRVL